MLQLALLIAFAISAGVGFVLRLWMGHLEGKGEAQTEQDACAMQSLRKWVSVCTVLAGVLLATNLAIGVYNTR